MNEHAPANGGAPASLTAREFRSVLFGILLCMFLGALDQTIIATALPSIARDLGDIETLPWVAAAYLVAATAVTPLYGKASDIYGRRVMMLLAISTFAAGSTLCALAPSMWVLVVARAVQGVGGGGLMSLGQTIIADLIPPKDRGRYQVHIATIFLSSSLLGPLLGGVLSDRLHWSAIFWINLPLSFAALAATSRQLRKLPRHDRPHRLDIEGAVLVVAATVALMLALNWGGAHHGWSSPRVLSLLALSLVLWALFGWRLASAAEPLVPLSVLANAVVRRGAAASACSIGTFIGLTICVPIYLEAGLGLSASQSGIALIPIMLGTVTGATISGRAMSYLVHYKRVCLIGLPLAIAASATIAASLSRLSLAAVEALLILTTIGLGTVLPVATVSVQNAVAPQQVGVATGASNFARQLMSAILVAAFGAIVVGGTGGAPISIEVMARRAAESGLDLAGPFRIVFAGASLMAAIALLNVWRMEERPLRGAGAETVPE